MSAAAALIAPSRTQLEGRLSPDALQAALVALHERRQAQEKLRTYYTGVCGKDHGSTVRTGEELKKIAEALAELEAFGA